MKSPIKLLFLQLQLCVYGLYLTNKNPMNTNFYTPKKLLLNVYLYSLLEPLKMGLHQDQTNYLLK